MRAKLTIVDATAVIGRLRARHAEAQRYADVCDRASARAARWGAELASRTFEQRARWWRAKASALAIVLAPSNPS